MSKNVICEMLNIEYPIFQGAMAWISTAPLVAAVSEAGGLGIIAGGSSPRDAVKKEIDKVRELTDKPFGVNLMFVSPFIDEIVDLICEEKIAVVTTGAGSPVKYMPKLQAAGVKVIPVVSTVGMAEAVVAAGADAVVAEGGESGGHVGSVYTMPLVPMVVDAVNVPVIAAGGIADGRGMAASFMLGADAVQLGTVFITSTECAIHENYKNAVLKTNETQTAVTGNLTGLPVRIIRNQLAKELLALENNAGSDLEKSMAEIQQRAVGKLRAAVLEGDAEGGSLMCGQIAGMIHEIKPCKQIIDEMVAGCNEVCAKAATLKF